MEQATSLAELRHVLSVEPLQSGDSRYSTLDRGLGGNALRKLRLALEDCDAHVGRFAKIAFTGHRGSGKTTELFRLEHDLQHRFFPLHLFVDETLLRDCDYTELLLWLTDSLVNVFNEKGIPLNKDATQKVASWFAEKVSTLDDSVKSVIALETEAEGSIGIPFAARLLARIKSMIAGSTERRQSFRLRLRDYSRDLLNEVNLLLHHAQDVLDAQPSQLQLLIVQDNLDRLPPDAARRLFCENADILLGIDAHCIFTAPIAMVLTPWSIGNHFPAHFVMPTVKVHHSDNNPCDEGIDALVALIAKRCQISLVFDTPEDARELARVSGGSLRDLVRLLINADLEARADDRLVIDAAAVRGAIKGLRIDFERRLIPVNYYHPRLARVFRDKADWLVAADGADSAAVEKESELFSQLLFAGAVLEYNGDRSWYDVHPAITEIKHFKDALAALEIVE